jgi:hypothetical protein
MPRFQLRQRADEYGRGVKHSADGYFDGCAMAQQFVRVERVHVNEGGEAVIGNVK